MKIGFIVEHYKLRNDVREMLHYLADNYDLTVFVNASEENLIPDRFKKRIMNQRSRTIWNRWLRWFYILFGNLPKTRKNYKDYIIRRLYKTESGLYQTIKARILVEMQMMCPQLLGFDGYLEKLDFKKENIDDIDVMFSFTDVNNENMMANIIHSSIPCFTYVYSWDHLAKFHRFSKKHIHYITWSDGLKNDLSMLHGISPNNISTLGASQYLFIHEHVNDESESVMNIDYSYFYYAAAFGYPKLAEQEIILVKTLAATMSKFTPDIHLVFRPYPMLNNWDMYGELRNIKNIIFDDFKKNEGVVLTDNDMAHKFILIKNADAVIHCGTTIGIEASYFDVPVIYLNPTDIDYGVSHKDKNHIFYSWDQYHLKQYYHLDSYQNVVTNTNGLENIIGLIQTDSDALLNYNYKLREISPLYSMGEFIEKLISIFVDGDNWLNNSTINLAALGDRG